MATSHESKAPGASHATGRSPQRAPRRFRWTIERYQRLGELGFFRNRRVELIAGDIVEMSPINPPHSIAVELLGDALRAAFGPGHSVRIQQPVDLGRKSEPEPDAAVVPGSARDYVAHPTSALLVVEVSDSSLRYDRIVKAHIYARSGMADYWIVNLVDRQLEIHRNPGPDPARPGRHHYGDVTIVPETGEASPLAAPGARIAVASLLP